MARMTPCVESLGMMTFTLFGRTNNNIIQLAHMLWYSRMTTRKLHIPVPLHWIHTLFDTSALGHRYCLEFDTNATKATNVTVVGHRQSFYKEGWPVTDDTQAEIDKITAGLFAQPRDPVRDFAVVCNVTSAVHLRGLEGSCTSRNLRQHQAANEICHMSSGYIRGQLRHCSTDHVFLATDDQQPQDTTRILKEFDGWRYKGRNAVIVDLMALAYAHKTRCAVLNPASTFTVNARAISTNAFGWCRRHDATDTDATFGRVATLRYNATR